MISRIGRFLGSAKLAAVLIALLVALLLLSFVVPQKDIMPAQQMAEWLSISPVIARIVQTLSVDHIFTSWWFYVITALLAVNLIQCTVRRIQRRATVGRAVPRVVPEYAWRQTTSLDAQAVLGELQQRVPGAVASVGDDGTTLMVRRGDVGFWGSVLMHAGLIVLIAGGVLSALTTFRGELLLTEGQTLPDAPESYLSVAALPRMGAGFGDFTVGLKKMTMTYREETITDAVALMHVSAEGAEKDVDARVNYPLKVSGKSFLLQDSGHSVQVSVLSPDRRILFDSYVNLANATPEGFSDTVDIGNVSLRLVSRPDASVPLNQPVRRSLALVDPIVRVELYRDAKGLGAGAIRPGGSQDFSGYTVVVGDVRMWTRFLVRADQGLRVIYLAFVMIVMGVFVRMIDPDRQAFAKVSTTEKGSDVAVWGRTRYSRAPSREQRRFTDCLQALIGSDTE